MKTLLMVYTTFINKHLTNKQTTYQQPFMMTFK